MKVYLTSCETGPGAWRHQEDILRDMWARSSRRHELIDDPAIADAILIGNLRYENWSLSLRRNPLIKRYPNKCFVLEEIDKPEPLLHGIYTAAMTEMGQPARFRPGSHAISHPDFKNPYVENYVGCAAEKPKDYLFSFSGRAGYAVRDAIFALKFQRPDVLVRHTTNFDMFTHHAESKVEGLRKFVDVMERSKFALCPRGYGASSIRLYEAMKIGVAPIIISDGWIPPVGPRWNEFAIFVAEKDVAQIEKLAIEHEPRYQAMGRLAAEEFQRYLSHAAYFDYIMDRVAEINARQKIPESFYWSLRNVIVLWRKVMRRLKLERKA